MLLSGYQTALQFAALVGFWSAFAAHSQFLDTSALQWKIPVAIQLIPGVLLLIGTATIAESPKFLALKGLDDSVTESITWLRGLPSDHEDVNNEIEAIYDSVTKTHRIGTGFFQSLKRKSIRRRLGVGIGLMIAQNMVGLNALNYCKFVMLL
jgi:hypothetical protein